MANVGNVSIKITADATKVEEELAKGGKAVKGFADSAIGKLLGVKGAAADAAAAMAAIKSGAGAAWSGLKSVMDGTAFGGAYGLLKGGVSGIGSLLSAGAGAASDAVSTLVAKYKELAPQINETWKNAQRLGTTMSDMMGLEALGLDAHVLAKFRKNDGTGDIVEGLAKFADLLAATESPADRVVMAMDRLGKTGAQALNVLGQGGEALKARLQQLRDIGYSLTDSQAQAVASAQRSSKLVSLMWQGAWNRVVVGMAPAFDAMSKTMLALAPTVAAGAERLGAFIGEAMKAGVVVARAVAEVLGIGEALGLVGGKGAAAMMSLQDWTKQVRAGLREVAAGFGNMFDHIRASMGPFLRTLGRVIEMMERTTWIPGVGVLIDANKKTAKDSAGIAIREMGEAFGKVRIGETADRIRALWGGMMGGSEGWFWNGPKERAFADSSRYEYSPVSAMQQNSKEAASVLARWRTGVLADPMLKVAKDQLQALTDIKGLLRPRLVKKGRKLVVKVLEP